MAQSAEIRHEAGFLSTLPLGSIIAWHRDLLEQGALSLPPGWVECNGQTLDDPESRFHGSIIPNLNLVDQSDLLEGREGGAFLRGAPRSGELQQDELQTHTHQDRGHRHFRNAEHAAELAWRNVSPEPGAHGVPGPGPDRFFNLNQVESATANLAGPTAFGAGAARHGAETRPVNMSVIWIMKVKQITAAQALPAVLAHEDAPHGAVFVSADGNIGIGEALRVGGPLSAPSSLESFVDRAEQWENTTDSPDYLALAKREIALVERTNVLVIGYGHGHTTSSPDLFITDELAEAEGFSEYRELIMRMAEVDVALDVAIFIDGELFDPSPEDLDVGWGTAITHSKSWVPLAAIASARLEAGNHLIELRYRARTGRANVNFNGPMMVTTLLGVPGER